MMYQVFRDPVVVTDGHTHEQSWITRLLKHHKTSSMTQGVLDVNELVSDIVIRQIVESFRNQAEIF